MYESVFVHLAVTAAIITGTGAALLSLLTWKAFRRSPFGKVVFVLAFTMGLFTIYHALLIVLPSEPLIVELFEAAVYTGVTGFVVLMLRTHHHLDSHTVAGAAAGAVVGPALAAVDPLAAYNLLMGLLASVGLVYFLYLEQFVGGYRRFVIVTTAGVLLYSGVGPFFELFASDVLVHAVHSLSALLVILGLYDPVHNDLRTDDWASVLLEDPSRLRYSANWMVPMDDRILELFQEHDLVLTPAIIATNLEYSREAVNRRLAELAEHGLVDRIDTGKYRRTTLGEQYLQGQFGTEGIVEQSGAEVEESDAEVEESGAD